jgi:hypothetical protein
VPEHAGLPNAVLVSSCRRVKRNSTVARVPFALLVVMSCPQRGSTEAMDCVPCRSPTPHRGDRHVPWRRCRPRPPTPPPVATRRRRSGRSTDQADSAGSHRAGSARSGQGGRAVARTAWRCAPRLNEPRAAER